MINYGNINNNNNNNINPTFPKLNSYKSEKTYFIPMKNEAI